VRQTVPEGQGAADGDGPARAEVRLLGRVRLVVAGTEVPLPGPVRDLLAVLALRSGERVSRDLLAAALWPAPPPRGGSGDRLETAVAELATVLRRTCGGDLLATGADSVVLRLAGRDVDVSRFAQLAARARGRLAAGDVAQACDLFAAALDEWDVDVDGSPLAGCAINPQGWAAAERTRLVQLRAAAVEDRWACALRIVAVALAAAGGPAADPAAVDAGATVQATARQAAEELERALRRHPLRERLWELLVTAAAFGRGRRAAGDAYAHATATFADSLGVEPGGRLRAVAELAQAGGLAEWWAAGDMPAAAARPAAANGPAERPGRLLGAAARATLPVPLTPLIGRDQLLARVVTQLGTHRLVTLTGPGGSGKTRLAIATARRMAAAGTEGRPEPAAAWFVDLSVVETPMRVPAAVAAVLGARDEAGRDAVDVLADEIGSSTTLLVLDNCEHLVAGAAELAGRLLARCPRLRILATSRIALRIPPEATVPVPPLAGPEPGTGHTLAGLAARPASRLFLDRARARSGRAVAAADADAVARLCAELDGLPLAIELAAARTPLLTVPEIVDRLRADLRLLRSPDPTAPARHRTVAAAIESSVDQLSVGARGLFDRLAVFAGGFDAEAGLAVGGPGPPARLDALVEASLVEALPSDGGDGSPRYRMLVPIRRHAHHRLVSRDGEESARRAHARYFLGLAGRADGELRGANQGVWLTRLRGDAANLRAAMGWLSEAGAAAEPYGDLRLAAALANYCRLEGHYRDGRAWLAAALARHPGAPPQLRARAGAGAAMLAMLLCEYDAAATFADAARVACRVAGDHLGEARVELTLGSVARERADYPASSTHLDAAAQLFAGGGEEWGEAQSALLRGFTAWLAGDLDRAEPRLRAALRRFERLGDPEAVATALMNLGAVAVYRGDPDRAASLLDTALDRFAAVGFPEGVGWAHNLRGLVELRAGRTDRAAAHFALSLAVHRQVGDRWRTASVLEAMAEVARVDGDPEHGATLLGAAAWIRTEIGTPVPACERGDLAATAAGLRAALGNAAYGAAHRRGQVAELDAVLTPGPSAAVPAP
jgi:predicted ATPase/DNA-binding SARP family transcriptional activator